MVDGASTAARAVADGRRVRVGRRHGRRRHVGRRWVRPESLREFLTTWSVELAICISACPATSVEPWRRHACTIASAKPCPNERLETVGLLGAAPRGRAIAPPPPCSAGGASNTRSSCGQGWRGRRRRARGCVRAHDCFWDFERGLPLAGAEVATAAAPLPPAIGPGASCWVLTPTHVPPSNTRQTIC